MAIAIDGPAAAGKSTIAKNLSEKLGYLYIDTGALYRAIGYFALHSGAVPSDAEQVRPLLSQINLRLFHQDGTQHISVNEEDVTEAIRRPEMSMAASDVSAIPEVRDFLLSLQQRMAQENDVVMDGRDIAPSFCPGRR
jgi:cytidylate kinase